MIKKIAWCFMFEALFLGSLFAAEYNWSTPNIFSSSEYTVSSLEIAQDEDYVLAAWISKDSSDNLTLYYNCSNDKGKTWQSGSESITVSGSAFLAVSVSEGIPLIVYGGISSEMLINYFVINSETKQWELNSAWSTLGTTGNYLVMKSKGNKAVIASQGSGIFYNLDISDATNFGDNWHNASSAGVYDAAMSTENKAFFSSYEADTSEADTSENEYTIILYELNLETEILVTYTSETQQGIMLVPYVVANENDEVILFYSLMYYETFTYDGNMWYGLINDNNLSVHSHDTGFSNIILYESVDFKGNNIVYAFLNLTETTNPLLYVTIGTYDNGDITFGESYLLNSDDCNTRGITSVELVDNYAVCGWVEFDDSNYYIKGAFKNLAETGDWIKNDWEHSVAKTSTTTNYVKLANYKGTSDGTLQMMWSMGDQGAVEVGTAYLDIIEPSNLNLSYSKYKHSFLLQDVYGNKIKWDLLEAAGCYNVYTDEGLSQRIYSGKNNCFVDYASKSESKTYYVSWVNLEGVEQTPEVIVVPK